MRIRPTLRAPAGRPGALLKGAPDDKDMPRVKFRHPQSGEETTGHLHSQGQKGATVVGPDGAKHQIEHGHYLHHKSEGVSTTALLKQAEQHLELGPQAMLAIHAVGVMLAAGGVDHASELTTNDVRVTKGGVLILPHKMRVKEPKRLVAMLSHLAAGDGPLLRVGDTPVDADGLMTYARRFGADQKPMKKASPLAMQLVQPSAAFLVGVTWVDRGYTCEYRQAPSGLHILSIRHPCMGLPLHEVTSTLQKARRMAAQFIGCLADGRLPSRGVFAPG